VTVVTFVTVSRRVRPPTVLKNMQMSVIEALLKPAGGWHALCFFPDQSRKAMEQSEEKPQMTANWILRFAVTLLRYPAPTFCERWGCWTPENKRRGAVGKWIWHQAARKTAGGSYWHAWRGVGAFIGEKTAGGPSAAWRTARP